jgi:diaminohydroxyphosphoribosylaminopyrimidine deaminase/5-amino-6-(5-phosphoribosylamino)uracil reductase
MVGAVIVKNKTIIGRGFHRCAGGPHAEVLALKQAGSKAHGATLYVTLEPCSHTHKRTPPCVPLILGSKVRRIVVAMNDPNPKVNGRGIRRLRKAGLSVDVGCLKPEAERLNEVYCHWVRTGFPFVILKSAMTLDGKIATSRGESKWITGEDSRAHVHLLRSQVDAILVGVGTVLQDNPQLTARLPQAQRSTKHLRQPVRVVLDSFLRIPALAKVFHWTAENPTIVATTKRASHNKITRLTNAGITVLVLPTQANRVSFVACMKKLGQMGLTSVLVEGGSEVHASALRSGLVNKVMLYIAPTLLGGQDSKSLIGGRTPKGLTNKANLRKVQIQKIGDDILFSGYPQVK